MKIALISDIHEDYQSLKQVAKLIEKNACDRVVCLGDIVGFSVPHYSYVETRNPLACVRWVMDNCSHAVAGNHDLYAVRRVPHSDVRGFEYPDNWYSFPFPERQEKSQGKVWLYEDNELSAILGEKETVFLQNLPETIIDLFDNTRVLLSHYIFPDLTGSAREFMFDYRDLIGHIQYMADNQIQTAFTGHMHCNGMKYLLGRDILIAPFNKRQALGRFNWFGLPGVTSSKGMQGFAVWDTTENTIEAISIRSTFSIFK